MKTSNIVLLILLGIICFIIGTMFQENIDGNKEKVSIALCNQAGLSLNQTSFLHGFYKSEGYYCVRTDTDKWSIKNTEYHEACHSMIAKNYKHFCEE